ncbi:hypothetical protein DWV00_03955 [Trinickia dinghuensis]|uniref:Uncharacterized protein n=2 Tax=Trinickia dinghuensis TaxID=2291023 RepID=A0A3D8K750_9BURK|nr:hypothetical protein DWV00_03955 [Trinickia dinghuensis]
MKKRPAAAWVDAEMIEVAPARTAIFGGNNMDWRDIVSVDQFRNATVLGGLARFSRSLGDLDQLDGLIGQYHALRKRDVASRVAKLGEIISAADQWLLQPPAGNFSYSIPPTAVAGVEAMALRARGKKSYLDAVVAFYLRYPSETAATENAFASIAERPAPVVPVRRRAASFSGRPSAPEPVSSPAPTPSRARSNSVPISRPPPQPQPQLALRPNYLVEKADPLHRSMHAVPSRSGLGMTKLLALWTEARTGGSTDLPFFYWLEEQNPASLEMASVGYLTKEQRRKHLLFVIDGKFLHVAESASANYSTEGRGSMSDGKVDWCIFVLSPDDVLFAGGYRMGEFHHSSFLAGDKIKAAGQICVIDGKLMGITPKSGHYHPGPDELCTMLKFLAERRIDLSAVEVWYPAYGEADPESKPFLIMADEFLRNGGRFDKATTSRVPPYILAGGRPNPEMMRQMAAAVAQRV